MNVCEFQFYDVSDFPIVRIAGSTLPHGYGPQWVAEMNALMANETPFAFIFLDSVENPAHADQKLQTQWLKQNKKFLAKYCRGAVAIEPDRTKRVLKRAQGLVMAAAFGLRFYVVAERAAAEQTARDLLGGRNIPDGSE